MAFLFHSRPANTTPSKLSKSDNSASVTAVLKSKWYAKTRPTPPPISTSPSMPTLPISKSSVASPLAQDLARVSSPYASSNISRSAPPGRTSKSMGRSATDPSKADATTATLAARLEELEASHSEGLLDDEGYRILRQNLFTSFMSPNGAVLPTEQPSVRLSRLGQSSSASGSKPPSDSNFHVSSEKAESIRSSQSKSTVSAMKTLFRKPSLTSPRSEPSPLPRPRKSHSNDSSPFPDTEESNSIYSGVSQTSFSNSIQRVLASSKSSGSLGSDYSYSRSQQDLTSLSSKRTATTTSRSARGPPSSYNLRRGVGTSSGSMDGADVDTDDAHAQTSAQIKEEMVLVEAEYRRIMDNYRGAELGALAKLPHPTNSSSLRLAGAARPLSAISQATVTEASFGNKAAEFGMKAVLIDPDKTVTITSRSTSPAPPPTPSKLSAFTRFGSLRRKPSRASTKSPVPSTAPLPESSSSLAPPTSYSPTASPAPSRKPSLSPLTTVSVRSAPNLLFPNPMGSRSRSNSNRTSNADSTISISRPSSTFAADSPTDLEGLVGEEREFALAQRQIDKIQKSREDAVRRYEGRLEYLRTKLKSAELHERLLKR